MRKTLLAAAALLGLQTVVTHVYAADHQGSGTTAASTPLDRQRDQDRTAYAAQQNEWPVLDRSTVRSDVLGGNDAIVGGVPRYDYGLNGGGG